MKIRRALLSVFEKEGIAELAAFLHRKGVRILSTGNTSRLLEEAGVSHEKVSDYTGFPEILDGRVKTLHPKIHGGILARRDHPSHLQVLQELEIEPIDLVVVNLYPFAQTVSGQAPLPEVLEQIDIGGPTLIRAAAKNHGDVVVVVDPRDYPSLRQELEEKDEVSASTRLRLAAKAFQHTAWYEGEIAAFFGRLVEGNQNLPPWITLSLQRRANLRYGENPHQRGALYAPAGPLQGWPAARQWHGKELSFNNLLDLDAAWKLSREFKRPFCAIIKHNNPCGAAVADELAQAYRKALACDPISAFGSVVALNRPVDEATAQELSRLFVEVVVAPGYAPPALELLRTRRNLRIMQLEDGSSGREAWDLKSVEGALLVQDLDTFHLKPSDLRTVTRRQPSEDELEDLLFAWRVAKYVKSNAIVLARQGQTLGIGAGQMSRVDSVRLAVSKAQLPLQESVLASDGFFPFPDGVEEAAKAGVVAIIQPGGSIRDGEVIKAADRLGLAMVFTGIRHFRH